MKLRHATNEDVSLLENWVRQAHAIAAGGPWNEFDWATELERKVPWREILIAELGDGPTGVLQVIDRRTKKIATGVT